MRSIVSALVAAAVALTTAAPALADHTPGNPGDEVTCGDFGSWVEAQEWFEDHVQYGDPAGLDVDGDFVACEGLPGASGPFTDVGLGSPFLAQIGWLALSGITTGFPDGSFHPGESISREAFAAFMYRYAHGLGTTPTCTGQRFDDVPVNNPFCGHIEWLADMGITTGYPDGGFHPGAQITREAVAAFFLRFRNLYEDTEATCDPSKFRDLPGNPFCDAITWLAGTGITLGYDDGTFRPGRHISREAMAAFFSRYALAFGSEPAPEPPVKTVVAQPAAPQFIDVCGTQDDSVVVPDDTAVLDYARTGEVGGEVTVTVAIKDPETHEFAPGVQTSWSYTFTDEDCPPPPPVNPECGDTLSEDVTLVADLHCDDPSAPALTIADHDVTLDLAGHSIQYTGPITDPAVVSAVGIAIWGEDGENPVDLVTVTNGQIAGFDSAVDAGYTDDLTLSDLSISGGISLRYSGGFTLRDSTVEGGVGLDYNGGGVRVENNLLRGPLSVIAYDVEILGNTIEAWHDGGHYGISLAESGDVRIDDNTITGGTVGISLAWDVRQNTSIVGNTISGSTTGIQLGGLVGDVWISANEISGVEHAIHLTPIDGGSTGDILGGGFWIRGNVITDTWRDAIRMNQGDNPEWFQTLDVSDNVISSVTQGYAIYAPYGATSVEGANTVSAIHEQDPPCLGDVECVVQENLP